MSKIDFEFTTKYGRFSDAIWIPDDAPAWSEEEIAAEKQRRLNNWIAIIETPSTEPEV